MKLFKKTEKWLENQEHLFYLFLFVLIVPNVALCFTEPLSFMEKLCNVLLPFACYYFLMTLSRNCGRTFWLLFPFVFLGAFQIVLLYLFGQSIIAVDMFLNLLTTNSTEAMELLDSLLPAIAIVVIIYVPALICGMVSIVRKRKLSEKFVSRERKRALLLLGISLLTLGGTYLQDPGYEPESDLYPVNVCYNIGLAFQRNARTKNYHRTSESFAFHARSIHPEDRKEVYVMVVGETARALNWQLYGYERETNPLLSQQEGLVAFPKVLSESNTTHKSVPMLISSITAHSYDSIYWQKGIVTAFKEAGYRTAFFSNQRYNRSFIDFFGQEADTSVFVKEGAGVNAAYNPSDDVLLEMVREELDKGAKKQFILLHTYGSHFNYRERYSAGEAFFKPDHLVDAEVKYRKNLINAYDNTIRYTDRFLSRLIGLLERQKNDAALIYTSDHGEDIFDDSRRLFLHASPVPSYYQLHVPFLVWMSGSYRAAYPTKWTALIGNREKDISSSSSFFPTMLDVAGIETVYRNNSLSVADSAYAMKPRVYLNDHNEPRPLDDLGMRKEDFRMLDRKGICY